MRNIRDFLIIALLFFIGTLALLVTDEHCSAAAGKRPAGELLQEEILQISAKAVEFKALIR